MLCTASDPFAATSDPLGAIPTMTGDPVDLNGRRTAAGILEMMLRKRPANSASLPRQAGHSDTTRLDEQLLNEPARTWIEAMGKCRLLLERYAGTAEAQDARTQKLIARALGDITRLKKREELKR